MQGRSGRGAGRRAAGGRVGERQRRPRRRRRAAGGRRRRRPGPRAAPQRRLVRLAVVLWVTALAVWWRILTGGSLNPLARIHLGPDTMLWPPAVLIVVLIAVVMLLPMVGQGRSPHLTGAAHLHRPLVEALRDAPWPARS